MKKYYFVTLVLTACCFCIAGCEEKIPNVGVDIDPIPTTSDIARDVVDMLNNDREEETGVTSAQSFAGVDTRHFTSRDGMVSFEYPTHWQLMEQGDLISLHEESDVAGGNARIYFIIQKSKLNDYDFDTSPEQYEELFAGISQGDVAHNPRSSQPSLNKTTVKCRLAGHNAVQTVNSMILGDVVQESACCYYVCVAGNLFMIEMTATIPPEGRGLVENVIETLRITTKK